MKIGVIIETFRLPLEQSLDLAAGYGIDGVQIYARNQRLTDRTPGELRDFAKLFSSRGLEIAAVCGDLGGHGFRSLADNGARIAETFRILEAMRELNCRVLTTHIGTVPRDTASAVYTEMAAALRRVGEFAAKLDMALAIETGPETAAALAEFLRCVGSPGIRVNFDPANLKMVQNADVVEAVAILGPDIVHTHAKDGVHYRDCDPERVYDAFARGGFEQLVAETGRLFAETPLGEGDVDFPRYLAALRKVGYDGYLTIEREVGGNPAADIRKAVEFLRNQLLVPQP